MGRKKYNQWEEWERIIEGSKIRVAIGTVLLVLLCIAAAVLFFTKILFEDFFTFGVVGFIIMIVGAVLLAMGIHDWSLGARALREHEYSIQRKKKKRNK